jgi:hypothetical protein
MRGAIPPLPQYVFMAWCLVKHRDNFTFTHRSARRKGKDGSTMKRGGERNVEG